MFYISFILIVMLVCLCVVCSLLKEENLAQSREKCQRGVTLRQNPTVNLKAIMITANKGRLCICHRPECPPSIQSEPGDVWSSDNMNDYSINYDNSLMQLKH